MSQNSPVSELLYVERREITFGQLVDLINRAITTADNYGIASAYTSLSDMRSSPVYTAEQIKDIDLFVAGHTDDKPACMTDRNVKFVVEVEKDLTVADAIAVILRKDNTVPFRIMSKARKIVEAHAKSLKESDRA